MSALADLLETATEPILTDWAARARRVAEPVLGEEMPLFLAELIARLRGAVAPAVRRPPDEFRPGFDVAAMIREYMLLRDAIFDAIEQRAPEMRVADVRVLASALSEAAGAAIAEHTRQRIALERERVAEGVLRLQRVTDALPFLISLVDRDEKYAMVNRAYEAWFAQSREQLIGRSVRDVIGEQAYVGLSPYVVRGLSGEAISFERHGVPYLQGNRDIRVNFVPQREPDGSPNGYVALIEDITERRRLEQELRLSNERLLFTLRAGHMGTWDLDLRTGTLQASDTCKANYGRRPDQSFTYDELAVSVLDEDRAAWRAKVEAAVAACSDLDVEYRTRWPDGSLHWVLVRASCSSSAGVATGMSGVSMLIDERKATEEALRSADRRKDEFLATASHELRTPLNAILGWATLLAPGTLGIDETRRAARIIERNARSQVQLIEDILDGSRMISGNLRLELEPLDPTVVVRAALDAIRPAAEAKNQQLVVSLDSSGARVLGDPERLQQVVWNLVNNAVKFTPAGGTIQVRLAHRPESVELSVKDTGKGIAESFLPHVFERFRQADGSTSRRHGGLGLGLALVAHLVDAHGGSVRAESDGDGKGSTFIVTLPLSGTSGTSDPGGAEVDGPSATAAQRLLAAPPLDGVSVLVVDDQEDALDIASQLLRARGAQVISAGSPQQALHLLAEHRPQVLVSDIGMPEIDGYSFLRAIRGGAIADRDIPAIALTAYTREEDRRAALAAGFQAHLTKPVDPAELVRWIAALARGRRAPA